MDEDLEQIKQTFLRQCGVCDFGLPEFGCTCPQEDYRPVMLRLVEEVARLREALRRAGLVVDPGSADYQRAQPEAKKAINDFLRDPSTEVRRERTSRRLLDEQVPGDWA